MPRDAQGFDRGVRLPPGLTIGHVRRAIDYVEQQAAEFADLYYEQANIFSGLVGILGVRALHALSPYKKHKHPDVAQQRFPDLSLGGKLDPLPQHALESKGSTRAWALQSHYNHAGWYIVWRYAVDPTKQMKPGRVVLVWRVDVPFVRKGDWKYEGSAAGEGRGGRTHTFGVRNPAKLLAGTVVYQAPGVAVHGGKPIAANGNGH
ncbi:MAG: hypothetical protein HYZ91_05540 [Candidatus Omnitrophica bacterium]|nr:hypothetical protein [Candidatus Omnitrophota bacterium]